MSKLETFKAYETSSADAVAADIDTGLTAYVKGGKVTGGGSNPAAPGNSLRERMRVFITDDATAAAINIAEGKTAFINGGKVTGTRPTIPASGLLSMLDASVPSSLFSDLGKTTNSGEGGSVAVWADLSGNGNDWTQSNASYRPVYELSNQRVYNNSGTPAAAADKHLVGPNISSWTQGSFFARFQCVSGYGDGAIWGTTAWNNNNSANHWAFLSGTHYICFGVDGRGSFAWTTPPQAYTDLMNVEENVNTTGVNSVYLDGTSYYSVDLGNTTFRTAPYLGCAVRSNVPQYSVRGYFYKFCAYNRILSAGERTTVNAWLSL